MLAAYPQGWQPSMAERCRMIRCLEGKQESGYHYRADSNFAITHVVVELWQFRHFREGALWPRNYSKETGSHL